MNNSVVITTNTGPSDNSNELSNNVNTGPSDDSDELLNYVNKNSTKFFVNENKCEQYDSLKTAYLKKITDPSSSQDELDKLYFEIKDCYIEINNTIRDHLPTTWQPKYIFEDILKYQKQCKNIESKNKNALMEFEIRKEKAHQAFRNALKAMKKRKAEAQKNGIEYKGKYIREKQAKPIKLLPKPTPVPTEVPINTNFRKNYMRRERKRNMITAMPSRHFIPVLTTRQKKNIRRKAARKRAWTRKNGETIA